MYLLFITLALGSISNTYYVGAYDLARTYNSGNNFQNPNMAINKNDKTLK